ncbi:hypothetical protein LTR70_003766 [Exophiala xenobiotica]|uniref:N-acetyltransferase domain-containing protein n=1 Tax=Lithohypha guttulata TaxID=1690604 RepID=A0ABR0KFK0_9EURO|nr:hypothetical protein LTR24_003367 [Lithohypha guttulata]KAK5322265.1 hypothetical protein LTR70_003766 [Exophiala xenobiotica]
MARLLTLTIMLLISCYQTWALPSQQQQQAQNHQIYLSDSNIHIRPATEADLDDITTVMIDAFAPGPLWRYAFQYQNQFKEYQWNCLREDLGEQLRNIPNNTWANVISVASQNSGTRIQGNRQERVIAIAAWKIFEPSAEHSDRGSMDLPGVLHNSAKCSDHLDANMTRMLDVERQTSAAIKRYVYDLPHTQLYLSLLATHPEWDGHGFGAVHCHWGMEMAKEMNVPVTLIGTPAGWPLYDSLGFKSVANITIKTLGKMEDLWYEYMRYDP